MGHDREILFRAVRGLRTMEVYRDAGGELKLAYNDGVLTRNDDIEPMVAAEVASMTSECMAWIVAGIDGHPIDTRLADSKVNDETARAPRRKRGP